MAAPLGEGLASAVHRLRLGHVDITTVSDGALVRKGLTPPFGLNADAGQVEAVARAARLPTDRFLSGYTPTLVNTGREVVLFDTGNGSHRRAEGIGLLRERLALAGLAPEDVDVLAFTHGHPDHIAGVMHEGQRAFPNARYVIGRLEHDAWMSGERIPERRKESRALFLELIPPLADRMTFLEPGQEVVAGITAVATFGHSIGHLAYRVESAGKSALIIGDALNHFVFSFRHPEWHMALDDDREQAAETRKRLLDMAASDDVALIGFHMPFPCAGYVERDKSAGTGAYRWVPMAYQFAV